MCGCECECACQRKNWCVGACTAHYNFACDMSAGADKITAHYLIVWPLQLNSSLIPRNFYSTASRNFQKLKMKQAYFVVSKQVKPVSVDTVQTLGKTGTLADFPNFVQSLCGVFALFLNRFFIHVYFLQSLLRNTFLYLLTCLFGSLKYSAPHKEKKTPKYMIFGQNQKILVIVHGGT